MKDYQSSSQRRFYHQQKVFFKFVKAYYFTFIPLFELVIIRRVESEQRVVNDVTNVSSTSENQFDRLIRLLEEQLDHSNQQNQELSKKLDKSLKQNEALTEQVRQLTKLLYGSKTEKSKYNTPDGQVSLFEDDHDPSFNEPEHTGEQSQQTISYTVVRKVQKKKRNDSIHDGIEVELFTIIRKIHFVTVAKGK